jgi:hypothetical protein
LNHILPSIFTLDTNADGSYKLSNEHKKMLGEIKQAIGLEPMYKISYNSKQSKTKDNSSNGAVGASACEQKTPAAKPQELNVQ